MTSERTEELYRTLRSQIERFAGKEMKMRRHFDMLAETVFMQTRQMLSPTTLRRFWGYQEAGVSVSRHTLDVLSMLLGYRHWDDFVQAADNDKQDSGEPVSEIVYTLKIVDSDTLECGQELTLTWRPNRRVVVVHEGRGVFRVVSNENSKLHVGDTFHCQQLIEGHPLICSGLLREGSAPMNYIAGKDGGIRFVLNARS